MSTRQPVFLKRAGAWLVAAFLVGLLQGCATLGGMVGGATAVNSQDPMESWNRKVFSFNEVLDEHLMQPVAKGYVKVTPEPVRIGVRNVFNNIGDVWSTLNQFLQGKFAEGTQGLVRVTVNTVFGLGGLIDFASAMQLDRHSNDFGRTLGVWGVKPGPYLVLPVLGPSTARDSFGVPGEYYFSASRLATKPLVSNAISGLYFISVRANLLGASGLLDDVALDKYAFMRDAYLQRRQNLIYDGNPPDEEEPPPLPKSGASPHADDAPANDPPSPDKANVPEAAASGASGAL